MKYRKKPIEVEATQWFKNGDHPEVTMSETSGFSSNCSQCGRIISDHGWGDALDEPVICPGDWIITDANGELSSCKPAIFEQTYEAVS